MTDPKSRCIPRETRQLDEYSQRELTAYRNIGTLREFRRLKHEEMHRRERRAHTHVILNNLIAGAFLGFLTSCLLLILTIIA